MGVLNASAACRELHRLKRGCALTRFVNDGQQPFADRQPLGAEPAQTCRHETKKLVVRRLAASRSTSGCGNGLESKRQAQGARSSCRVERCAAAPTYAKKHQRSEPLPRHGQPLRARRLFSTKTRTVPICVRRVLPVNFHKAPCHQQTC